MRAALQEDDVHLVPSNDKRPRPTLAAKAGHPEHADALSAGDKRFRDSVLSSQNAMMEALLHLGERLQSMQASLEANSLCIAELARRVSAIELRVDSAGASPKTAAKAASTQSAIVVHDPDKTDFAPLPGGVLAKTDLARALQRVMPSATAMVLEGTPAENALLTKAGFMLSSVGASDGAAGFAESAPPALLAGKTMASIRRVVAEAPVATFSCVALRVKGLIGEVATLRGYLPPILIYDGGGDEVWHVTVLWTAEKAVHEMVLRWCAASLQPEQYVAGEKPK
jgi:hypothetical protein